MGIKVSRSIKCEVEGTSGVVVEFKESDDPAAYPIRLATDNSEDAITVSEAEGLIVALQLCLSAIKVTQDRSPADAEATQTKVRKSRRNTRTKSDS